MPACPAHRSSCRSGARESEELAGSSRRRGEELAGSSYLRRSFAPEIDHESPGKEEEREARRRREVSYTRSLERGRLGRGEVNSQTLVCCCPG